MTMTMRRRRSRKAKPAKGGTTVARRSSRPRRLSRRSRPPRPPVRRNRPPRPARTRGLVAPVALPPPGGPPGGPPEEPRREPASPRSTPSQRRRRRRRRRRAWTWACRCPLCAPGAPRRRGRAPPGLHPRCRRPFDYRWPPACRPLPWGALPSRPGPGAGRGAAQGAARSTLLARLPRGAASRGEGPHYSGLPRPGLGQGGGRPRERGEAAG
mmetsp:Transcript_40504/g.90960  ORF Transcript_40504/g.90960 Transcript_40504/m.90960 type:complete len:212 (-) Transcript_40504:139-774(-)